jgi:hypothetical protein
MKRAGVFITLAAICALASAFLFPALLFAGDDFVKDKILVPAYNAAGALPGIGNTLQGGMKSSYNTFNSGASAASSYVSGGLNSIGSGLNSFQTSLNPMLQGIQSRITPTSIGQTANGFVQGVGTYLTGLKISLFGYHNQQGVQTVQRNIFDMAPKVVSPTVTPIVKFNQTNF